MTTYVALINAFIVSSLVYMSLTWISDIVRRVVSIKRVGGLYHWRCGRIGGSLYIAKHKSPVKRQPRRKVRLPQVYGFGIDRRITPRAEIARLQFKARIAFAMRQFERCDLLTQLAISAEYRNGLVFA